MQVNVCIKTSTTKSSYTTCPGILSSVNIIDEGALDALLNLAAYDPELARDDNQSTNSKAEQQEQYQLEERVSIIQSWAAKAVSAISGIRKNED